MPINEIALKQLYSNELNIDETCLKMNGHQIQEVSVDEVRLDIYCILCVLISMLIIFFLTLISYFTVCYILQPLPTLHRKLTQENQQGNMKEPESIESELEAENTKVEQTTTNGRPIVPPGFKAAPGTYDDPVICKLEPYNICYRFDEQGNLHPLGARRPVRLIRIYK